LKCTKPPKKAQSKIARLIAEEIVLKGDMPAATKNGAQSAYCTMIGIIVRIGTIVCIFEWYIHRTKVHNIGTEVYVYSDWMVTMAV
jgi:hypothetical protein